MENAPLAHRLRPKNLEEFVGQTHLVGPNGIIRKMLEGPNPNLFSMILWGPPGSGKTTLARIIAKKTESFFVEFSAVSAGKQDIAKIISEAKERLSLLNRKTILFLDEIHRFNKAQQAIFLPPVEEGTIILIGAMTENPSFEVISPLLSRCRVFVLNQLEPEDLKTIAERGIAELGGKKSFSINSEALDFLVEKSGGDARVVLNALEIAKSLTAEKTLTLSIISEALQSPHLLYDKQAEEHYNLISALHKSMRGSDPDASLYYLARMLEAGEDPLYIARRLIRFASEDVGNADFRALLIATAAFEACDKIGMPECDVILAQTVTYLSLAKKSNICYTSYRRAAEDVHRFGGLPVPLKLRNAVTSLMKGVGYGKNYKYAPNYKPEELKNEVYLPEKLKGKKYYIPDRA